MARGGSGGAPCEKHRITGCIACAIDVKTLTPTKAVEPPVHPAYSEPPIEEWLQAADAELDKVQQAKGAQPRAPIVVEPGKTEAVIDFSTLPVDDSIASKVTRAAAAYSKASTDYAKAVVAVETLKAQLLVEEAKLSKAIKTRQEAEGDLHNLTYHAEEHQ